MGQKAAAWRDQRRSLTSASIQITMIDVVIFFFLLGLFARLVGSDLRLPESLYETLSIYLLLAIGLKGGVELSQQPLLDLVPEVTGVVFLSFLIPLLLYPLFRFLKFDAADSASVGAHFGVGECGDLCRGHCRFGARGYRLRATCTIVGGRHGGTRLDCRRHAGANEACQIRNVTPHPQK